MKKGKQYSDTTFLPQISSIYDEYDVEVALNQREQLQSVIWKRASEIYPQAVMFKDTGVTPSDIVQGFLGNGYLLTVLSAMSEDQ